MVKQRRVKLLGTSLSTSLSCPLGPGATSMRNEQSLNGTEHSLNGNEHSLNGNEHSLNSNEHSLNGNEQSLNGNEQSRQNTLSTA